MEQGWLAGLLSSLIDTSPFITPSVLLIALSKDFFFHLEMGTEPINTQFKQDIHKDSSEIIALLLF